MTAEERHKQCLAWIQKLKADADELRTNQVDATKFYYAEALGNEIPGRSQVVTTDLADTVEWIIPSLMRIFAGGDDVVSIQPRGAEDVHTVKQHNELVNYQLRVRNPWFIVVHDFLKDALLYKIGIFKYEWVKLQETIERHYEGLTELEVSAKMQDPAVRVKDYEVDENGIFKLITETIVTDEYPKIMAVPPHEVGFPKDLREIGDDCPFFYHKTKLYPYQIDKRYGAGKSAEIKNKINSSSQAIDGDDTVEQARLNDLGGSNFILGVEDDGRYWVYECYFLDPDTGESRRVTLAGDVILEDEPNLYKRPPFHIATPIRLTHRVIGRSVSDLVKDLQKLRTVLIRQILDNMYFSNSGRYVADESRVNLDDLLNNNVPGGYVRGDPTAIKDLTPPQLQPWTFKLLEMIQTERENRTGVTRYNQGIDANSLNKTARGINAILSQSQQRIEMMARIFAEMGIAPLVDSVMDMNMRFLQRKTAIRVLNQWIEINPDNLVGKWDVITNVGIGTGSKDLIIGQMQQLLGIYAQLSSAGVPIISPTNVYNACKELVRAMGFRNVDDFFTAPQSPPLGSGAMPGTIPGTMPGTMPGTINGGTFQGQDTPVIPTQPAQPNNPVVIPDGGGYFG